VEELEDIGKVWIMSARALISQSIKNLLSQDSGASGRLVTDLPIWRGNGQPDGAQVALATLLCQLSTLRAHRYGLTVCVFR
jgi:hypothetical protein